MNFNSKKGLLSPNKSTKKQSSFKDTITLETELFSMAETAEKIGTGRNKLYAFLRKHGIFNGTKVKPEFLFMGYFEERSCQIQKGNFSKRVNLISVTPKGLRMISQLAKLLNPKAI
jgi:phage antirepressor YoqD-like protein